jgi:hypothetical protein
MIRFVDAPEAWGEHRHFPAALKAHLTFERL